jgi:hypothetical protein
MTSLPAESAAPKSRRLLAQSGAFWFISAFAGQALFAVYIFFNYGLSTLQGNTASWNESLFNGLIQGDRLGNALLAVHLFLAFLITLSGPLQLIPAIRNRARAFHRWNGRAYILIALVVSAGAILLQAIRPAFGGLTNQILQSINGGVIFACALLAWQAARGRRFAAHRRWATRLFLAASGVWFLRVMMMAWAIPTGGAGLGEELDGPAGRAAMLGQTLIPLGVYQIYLWAEESRSELAKYATAGLVSLLTFVMLGGILGATMVMWLPRILG